MDLYTLTVVHEGRAYPTETIGCPTAADVLEIIPRLLAQHPDCHRIHVRLHALPLFSVDCSGDTVRD